MALEPHIFILESLDESLIFSKRTKGELGGVVTWFSIVFLFQEKSDQPWHVLYF